MEKNLRPVAVPLVSIDPFFSVWSFEDKLYDDATRHWTGRRNSIGGYIQIDDKWYKFLGNAQGDNYRAFNEPEGITQTSVTVEATTTKYTFENDIVFLSISFINGLLPDDLDTFSRPVCYLDYNFCLRDFKEHKVKLFFDIGSEITSSDIREKVSYRVNKNSVSVGRVNQDILTKSADDMLINWGYLHLSAPGFNYHFIDNFQKREVFRWNNPLKEIEKTTEIANEFPSLCAVREYESTRAEYGFLMFAYDDIYSVEFLENKLIPYWKKSKTFDEVLEKALEKHEEVKSRCYAFDKNLRAKANNISLKYADLICLSYRQIMAGHKLVCYNDDLLYMSKECYSNGCIATVDVTYPSIPVFLLLNTTLAKAMLKPIFIYSRTDKWKYDFAPHDLGTYPIANGQTYIQDCERINDKSADLDQMPVEECGNMIICTTAICEKDKDYSFAKENMDLLKKWADYLVSKGYDPENQLCTDDFGGSFAHNCNLSIKLIVAIGAFGKILNNLNENGQYYIDTAKAYAKLWEENAKDNGHYKFTFDKNDTWSLKYNLVWDKYLNLNIFGKDVFETEVAFYKTKLNKYGVPLDYRKDYTKSDWQMWTACLTDDFEYRNEIINRMWDFVNESPDRAPFGDWYETKIPKKHYFQARTVQGGLFMPLLFEEFKGEDKNIKIIKENWRNSLKESYSYEYKKGERIDFLNKKAEELLKLNDEKKLWKDLLWDKSADLTTSYSRLNYIAHAYNEEGSKFYKSEEILEFLKNSLDWMFENEYGNKELYHSGNLDFWRFNWWDWQIGSPKNLFDILLILSDEIPYEKICKYLIIFDFIVKKPFDFGTNKLDYAILIMKSAVLKGDFGKVQLTLSQVMHLFEECDNGANDYQGFYSDGTYIFHGKHPMNGIYGFAFLYTSFEIYELLCNTECNLDKEFIKKLEKWFVLGYIPLVNYESFSRMFLGRAPKRGKACGSYTIDFAKRIIKNRNNQDILDFVNNKTKPFSKMYNFSDKAVVKRNNKAICISMSSSRIYNYECINDENMNGWYIGDGMVNIYADNNRYYADYWDNINPYFIPGTTADTQERKEISICEGAYLSGEDFVGGCTMDKDLVAVMCLESFHNEKETEFENLGYGGAAPIHKCSLKAKKSWFCFGDEVICLGSDINANDGFEVLTTLENTDKEIKTINEKQFEIEGLGIYSVLSENKAEFKQDKMTALYISHGKNPKNESYAYAITDNLKINSEILCNNEKIQAVKYKNKLGIIFYEKGEFENIKVNKPCVIIIENNKMSFCNPTHNNEEIEVKISEKSYKLNSINGETISIEMGE